MNPEIKKEVIYNLTRAIEILERKDSTDIEELKKLSDHAIEDAALHRDLDLISTTVLIYSIYKVIKDISNENYRDLMAELKFAKKHLENDHFSKYNRSMKLLFEVIQKCDNKVKEHLDDVMQAAKIKKGTVLLSKGLSIGQAAGLMGLSNWDLQHYAGRSTALEKHKEIVPAKKRLISALELFEVK